MGDAGKLMTASYKQGGIDYVFLKNGTYYDYSISSDHTLPGYPYPVTDSHWPGLGGYGKSIVATLGYEDYVYYFLANGKYIKYNRQADKAVSGYPKPVNDNTWPGLGDYAKDITAVVNDLANPRYAYFFLHNNTFIKYDKQADKAVAGYPKPINNKTWPNLLEF